MAKTLIAFFSRADENYFGGAMRYVKVGNTEIVVNGMKEMIAADTFKIEMKEPYSPVYMTCIEEAKRDLRANARPELTNYLDSIDDYDTVILAYPNYWGTMPMAVYTFLDRYDFTGKTILPLCTNEGSGMGSSEGNIKKLRRCKTNAQKIDPKSVKVPEDDKQAKGLMDTFQKCLVIFSGVCDAYIQFETALMNKANGEEKVSYSDIKNYRDKMRLGRENLNKNLDELNIWYAEFNDMERAKEEDAKDLGGVAFMTYEDLMSSDGEEK